MLTSPTFLGIVQKTTAFENGDGAILLIDSARVYLFFYKVRYAGSRSPSRIIAAISSASPGVNIQTHLRIWKRLEGKTS